MLCATVFLRFKSFTERGVSMKYAWILFVVLLVSCGWNDMTKARAQKALEGFTQTDEKFLKYSEGRSIGEVSGVIQTDESSVEIMFTLVKSLSCWLIAVV